MSDLIPSRAQKPHRLGRRSFLTAFGASAVVLSSGCIEEIRGEASSPPQLGWVAVKNYHPEAHRFDAQIIRAGSVVHEASHEVAGKTGGRIPGEVLECAWGAESGPFTLRGRVDDREWVEQSVANAIDNNATMDGTTSCVIAEGAYAQYGDHKFAWQIQDWCGEVSTYNGGCSFTDENP